MQRQYCGALGKKANCQVAPSVHYVSPRGHYPLAMRLYLPEVWLDDEKRLEKAGVPEPARRPKTKGEIALELLDRVRAEGLPGRLVVADAGYGVSGPFREGLAARGLHYIVGVTDEMVVFTEEPRWEAPGSAVRPSGSGGRPRRRSRLKAGEPRPVSLKSLAAVTPLRKVTWREGTKGKLSGRFAWLRVWLGGGWATGECAGADPVWLLIEEQADGTIKYAVSNLPGRTSRIKAVRLWKSRWAVEQGYQQMKEELGLDHHEGRSWRGFHHHACLVMLAFGFLALEREREERDPARPGKKGVRDDAATFGVADQALRSAVTSFGERGEAQLRDPDVHPARQKVLESLGNHWSGLTVFVEHPEVPMDNNTAERSERGPVVGRKNYYGSGSVWSGELAAMLFSLFQTLCLSGLNPRLWLRAYLSACAEVGGRAPANVDQFLPWNLSPEKRREWGCDDSVPAGDTS